MASETKSWKLFVCGMLGAVSPDILILYSKRFSQPELTFSPEQYILASIAYVTLAGVLASILPEKRTLKSAIGVGLSTPVVLSVLGSLVKTATSPARGGEAHPGTLLDLLSLF